MEVFDAIEENASLVHAAGGCAIIHSDDPIVIQRLNQEAAAALSAAWRADIQISKADAVRWFTANPAKALGIADRVGTLEPGKNADVTLRSEEHTSELQSLMRISYAVFCLKKKQNKTNTLSNNKRSNIQ